MQAESLPTELSGKPAVRASINYGGTKQPKTSRKVKKFDGVYAKIKSMILGKKQVHWFLFITEVIMVINTYDPLPIT